MPSSSRYGCLTCCLASDCFGALKGMNQQPLETLQQHQSPTAGAAISVTKTLTRLLAIPANRSCADCKSALVDSSQVHASYSPDLATTEKPKKTAVNHHFWRNHAAFAPPTELGKLHSLRNHIPSLKDLPVDPAITAASQKLCGHGVFVCALCAAAHKLLSANTTCVKAVMDITNWTAEDVQLLQAAGGNAKATSVLEAYYCKPSSALTRIALRPTAKSSIEDRLTFIRAKYEALAFVLPPFGPLAEDAWQKIVSQHPEWSGLWGADLKSLSSLELAESGTQSRARKDGDLLSSVMLGQHAKQRSATELPNRLVDFFCVVTPSDYLHPEVLRQDLSTAAPEDMLLAPHISDCFPAADSYDSNGDNECNTFPEHVSTFVFPDGCRASTMALPPTFFTFVLTNAAGERLYGGALRIYDDDRDTVETLSRVLLNSNYPASLWPSWLPPPAQAYRSSSLPHLNPSKSMSRPNLQSTRNLTLGSANVTSDVVFLPKCLVILSHYPFFDLWRKFLLQLYRIALTEAPLPIERFVANFVCEVPLPPPGKVQVKFGFTIKDNWSIERPPENQLPLANFSYQPLFASLSVSNVLVVMGCLLQETRVALLCKHYALLGPVAEALLSLLFPLHWQGMYLPIMPYNMLEILDAPVPYLVGLHSRFLTEIPVDERPQAVVLVDLDRDEVHLGFCDDSRQPRSVPSLPERHALKLKAKLLEFAACAYLMPNTQRAGYITTGAGENLSQSTRDLYAQTCGGEVSSKSTTRRKDVFPNTDKAYRDNELLVPISGFLSEHGHFYQLESSEAANEKKRTFQFMLSRSKKNSFSDASAVARYPQDDGNLFELKEPPGFSSSEIRQAFLRFFVSLFQNYRSYLEGIEFRSSDFLTSLNLPNDSSDFIAALLDTQMFHNFVVERVESSLDPEVRFFDDSINAKINRSKKVALTGRTKETSFLKDTRSMVTETFTPPPPSNFGLPDDGRSYHYGTFPPLDHDQFGKIRHPVMWEDHRASLRVGRRASMLARANEQAVVEKATLSLLTIVTKRGVRNVETALKALSTPFGLTPRVSSALDGSNVYEKSSPISRSNSDVTLPSMLDLTPEIVSSAEEIIQNARRKHAILIGIIVKLQRLGRAFLIRNRSRGRLRNRDLISKRVENDLLKRQASAAVLIQSWVRTYLARYVFTILQRAVVRLQAHRRGLMVRFAYHLLLSVISKAQSVFRGRLVRRSLSALITKLMNTYKKHMFLLWSRAYTPLSYRSKFWSLLESVGFVRLALAEEEIKRLWKELKIQPPNYSENGEIKLVDALSLNASNIHYWKCLKVAETLVSKSVVNQKLNANGGMSSSSIDRVQAERTQIYDRLSLSSIGNVEHINNIFARFSIPLNVKKKKVALTESLWTTYDEADQSAKLILEMFPELNDSTDLFFLMPSKKAFRRFPASQPLPRPLDRSMRAHRILHDRISRATVEVADIALRKLPSLTIYLDKKLTSKRLVANVHPRLLEAVITTRGISNPFVARQVFIREVLLSGTRRQSSFVERGKNLKGIVEKNYGGGKLNGKNTYHGANFWEVEQSASSNARSVP